MAKKTCDCPIEQLKADYERDHHPLRFIRWDATTGYLYCDRHRVFVVVEWPKAKV